MKEVDSAMNSGNNHISKVCNNCLCKNISYNILQPDKDSALNELSCTNDDHDIPIKLDNNQLCTFERFNN